MATTIEQAIEDAATGPRKAKVDGVEVEQHPIKDLIEADQYLATKAAAANRGLGIRISKMVPPGAE